MQVITPVKEDSFLEHAVIDTVRKDSPLNVMYWAVNEDGTYEVLDGQQRIISMCQYVVGDFSVEYRYFHNLKDDEKEQTLDYKLMVYFCEGSDKEKLEWFKTINIASEKLTPQELRNAVYTGPWLTDAKRYFSRNNGAAYNLAKGVGWGVLYNQFNTTQYDTDALEAEVTTLMKDDDVTKKSGVYLYVLTRHEKRLSIRAFTDNMKREAYERQRGICPNCGKHFDISDMEADHITPWTEGGKTTAENCQMLCREDNRRKGSR